MHPWEPKESPELDSWQEQEFHTVLLSTLVLIDQRSETCSAFKRQAGHIKERLNDEIL